MAVKRIIRYLKGTLRFIGILCTRSAEDDLIGFSDSDWAGDLDNRKSTSGYLFKLSSGPISWRNKKQTSVALSTAEAEYIALSSAMQEAMWLRQLMSELRNGLSQATIVYESAIVMAQSTQFHGRALTYDIISCVSKLLQELLYCRSDLMVADMLTKGLSCPSFEKLRTIAGITSIPEHFSTK